MRLCPTPLIPCLCYYFCYLIWIIWGWLIFILILSSSWSWILLSNSSCLNWCYCFWIFLRIFIWHNYEFFPLDVLFRIPKGYRCWRELRFKKELIDRSALHLIHAADVTNHVWSDFSSIIRVSFSISTFVPLSWDSTF